MNFRKRSLHFTYASLLLIIQQLRRLARDKGVTAVLTCIPALLFQVTAEDGRRNLLRNVSDEFLIDKTSYFSRLITVISHVGCW